MIRCGLAALPASIVALGPEPAGAVVGGTPLTPSAHPAIVAIAGACTGTLVGPRRVLTAAHCVDGVTGGQSTMRVGGRRYRIRAVARDPRYPIREPRPMTRAGRRDPDPPYDVGVIELERDVRGVAPLPTSATPPAPGAPSSVIGYGTAATPDLRDPYAIPGRFGTLRSARNVLRSDAQCRAALKRTNRPGARDWRDDLMLCTQDPDGRAPHRSGCYGDSGSPLLATDRLTGRDTVYGVQSWSIACGKLHNDPSVYMALAPSLDFLLSANPAWAPRVTSPPRVVVGDAAGDTATASCRIDVVGATTLGAIRWYAGPRGGRFVGRGETLTGPAVRARPLSCTRTALSARRERIHVRATTR